MKGEKTQRVVDPCIPLQPIQQNTDNGQKNEFSSDEVILHYGNEFVPKSPTKEEVLIDKIDELKTSMQKNIELARDRGETMDQMEDTSRKLNRIF